jgi:hypothetical protein
MTLFTKVALACVIVLCSPAFIALIAFGRWSRDNLDISIPAAIYLLPLLLGALLIRRVFRAKRLAAGIYIVGMAALLALAIAALGSELHGPVFGYVYIPTIILSSPFGLMAIFDNTVGKKKTV